MSSLGEASGAQTVRCITDSVNSLNLCVCDRYVFFPPADAGPGRRIQNPLLRHPKCRYPGTRAVAHILPQVPAHLSSFQRLQARIYHSDYNNELTRFLPRTILLKKPPGAQLGFNIRGGKASQLGIFISKVIPDSDAHRAGLQEGDQVLTVNNVDFQDIEHGKAVEILKTAREIFMQVRYFPYNYQRQKERTVH
uniref:PDZ domain-containing protein 11 n=1 Tax=Leptobrachium leishanense TaxID=445787 RepID=A0A8C5MID3_9ANUR